MTFHSAPPAEPCRMRPTPTATQTPRGSSAGLSAHESPHTYTRTLRRARMRKHSAVKPFSHAPHGKAIRRIAHQSAPVLLARGQAAARARTLRSYTFTPPTACHKPNNPPRTPLHQSACRAPSASGQLRSAGLRGRARRRPPARASPAHRSQRGPAAPAGGGGGSSVLVVGAQYEAGRLRRGRLARSGGRAAAAAWRRSRAFHLP